MIRFKIAVAFALMFAALPAVTLLWPQWIELVFDIDPDRGSGDLEVLIVVAAAVLAAAASMVAVLDRRRLTA